MKCHLAVSFSATLSHSTFGKEWAMMKITIDMIVKVLAQTLHSRYVQLVTQLKKHLCISVQSKLLKVHINNNVGFPANIF